MDKNTMIADMNLNIEQRKIVSSIINRFGCSQHPVCDSHTFDGFYLSYLISITKKKKFKASIPNFTPKGLEIWKSVEELLNEIQ